MPRPGAACAKPPTTGTATPPSGSIGCNWKKPSPKASRSSTALLPPGAVEAMDQFYRENGIDPQGEPSFVCQAAKHAVAIKWINRGAWTADADDWIEDAANSL